MTKSPLLRTRIVCLPFRRWRQPDTHARRAGFLFTQRLFRRNLSTCIHTSQAQHTQFMLFVVSVFLHKIHWMQSIHFESECDAELKILLEKNRKENRNGFFMWVVSDSHTFKVKLVWLYSSSAVPHRTEHTLTYIRCLSSSSPLFFCFPLLIVPMRTNNEIQQQQLRRLQEGKVKKNTFKSKMRREIQKQCEQCRHRRDMCSNACSRQTYILRSYHCQVIYTLNDLVVWEKRPE